MDGLTILSKLEERTVTEESVEVGLEELVEVAIEVDLEEMVVEKVV